MGAGMRPEMGYNYCSNFEFNLIRKANRNYFDIRIICDDDDYDKCLDDYISVKSYVN